MSENMHSFAEAVKICVPFASEVQRKWKQSREAQSASNERDENGSDGQKHPPQTHKISCYKGCGACCHYAVISSSSIEAFVLLTGWLSNGSSLQQIHDACMAYSSKFRHAITKLGHFPFSYNARLAFMAERLPCPAFQPTPQASAPLAGHCGVYSARPVICSQFHSTSDPRLCEELKPHGTLAEFFHSGEAVAHDLRLCERQHFGKSALGHLPLILAALTTQEGLNAFLRRDTPTPPTEDEPLAQDLTDFQFYAELLGCVGIELGERDFADLEKAQTESPTLL